MSYLSINLKQRARKALPWILSFTFLLGSSGVFRPLASSTERVGNGLTEAMTAQAASGCSDPDFVQPATSPEGVGISPFSSAAGDFNRDGKVDLAVANILFDTVSILLGDGTGNFNSPHAAIDVGDSPNSIVVADFNLDGKLDLATVSGTGDVVTILIGDGAGNFTALATTPAVGSVSVSMAVGDFNLDGRPDLAAASLGADNVTILLGDGTGKFTPAATSPESVGASGSAPTSVVVGDFNRDGKPDLATANQFANNVSILLGDGTGNFTKASTSPEPVGGEGPSALAVGDFNLDGKADLAVANSFSNNVAILLGDGTGNFSPAATSPETVGGTDSNPTCVVVADFNNDKRPDLATANSVSNDVSILLGDGTGNFTPSHVSPKAVGSTPQSVTAADFNGDGRADIAAVNEFSDNVTIFLNTCTAPTCQTNLTPPTSSPEDVGDRPFSVAVGDFNLDGKPDLATANLEADTVTILLGDGTGNFTPASTSPETVGNAPEGVAVGDFNNDGKPDLAVTNNDSNNVTILLGDGTGNFTPAATSPEDVGANSGPRAIVVGDFNLDGKLDLGVANQSAANVTILLGDGTGNFTATTTGPESISVQPEGIAVGDFNLDGKPDLAAACFGSNTRINHVSILLGDGTGNFTQPSTSPEAATGRRPVSVAVGDFNRDGKPDLATANSDSNDVSIMFGDGTGNFTPAATATPVGTQPFSVSAADFNLDGKLDLAVSNLDSNNVTILLGNGAGSFTALTSSPQAVGTLPISIAVGDFNRDGRPDVATANSGSDNVTILLNSCNTAPTISALSVSQVADTSSTSKFIASVSDPDQALETLTVAISSDGTTFSSSASLNGVSISSLAVDSTGKVAASVAASCTASTAGFTLKVTDNASAISAVSLNVSVTPENKPPQITCANVAAQSAPTNASCQAAVPDVIALVRAQSSDNCTAQGSLTITQNPTAGSNVSGAGSHPITVTVTDAGGNHTDCVVAFSVVDNTPPSITAPADMFVGTDPNQCSAVVTFPNPAVSDNCSGVGTPTCAPPSGSVFAKGTTSVTCKVSDAAGNQASCSFGLTVLDTQAPSITPPANISVPALPNSCSAPVSYPAPAVSDNCPGVGAPSCNPPSGSTFQKGTTTVVCVVSDASGNGKVGRFTITVVDTQPPQIATPPTLIVNTVNAGDASVAVNFPDPAASDLCSVVEVVCVPPSGSQFPKGVTTVTCTAFDDSANRASSSFTVKVFDYVIADDLNGKLLRFVSTTGDYDFFDCRKNQTASGRGVVTINFCKTELIDTSAGRNLSAQANPCTKKGNASLTLSGVTHTLNDSNLSSNPVRCP